MDSMIKRFRKLDTTSVADAMDKRSVELPLRSTIHPVELFMAQWAIFWTR